MVERDDDFRSIQACALDSHTITPRLCANEAVEGDYEYNWLAINQETGAVNAFPDLINYYDWPSLQIGYENTYQFYLSDIEEHMGLTGAYIGIIHNKCVKFVINVHSIIITNSIVQNKINILPEI